MNRITKWFLEQKALTIFLLCILGVPIYIWLFSIIYQLDKKRNKTEFKNVRKVIAGLATLYPIGYFIFFIGSFFDLFGETPENLFDFILPFHFTAMFCGFILMGLGANSYGKYEKEKGLKTYEPIGVFFILWFYMIGIWILQPNLNDYVKE